MSIAKEIYVIGYRAEDEIIEDILSTAKPETQTQIIDKTRAGYVQERISKITPNLRIHKIHQAGFMDFVDKFS